MHITSDRLTQSLTKIELMHIESCTQCKTEREKLKALRLSANQISDMQPPDDMWAMIEKNIPTAKKEHSKFKQFLMATAASFFVAAIGWLMWSNYQLQGQLQQVLFANQQLDLQMKYEKKPTVFQVKLLNKMNNLEQQLINVKTEKDKIELLNARYKLMKTLVEYQKGENREYSI